MDIQGIYVRSHQQRTSPDKHLAYAVEVHGPRGRTWTVWRRYSEFETLVKEMEAEMQQQQPLHPSSLTAKGKGQAYTLPHLPPKRAGLSSFFAAPLNIFGSAGGGNSGGSGSGSREEQFIKDRQVGLERFLRGIVASTHEGAAAYRETHAFRQFIAAPTRGTTTSTATAGPGKGSDKLGSTTNKGDVHFTSSSWLEEYHSLESTVKEIQSLINRRDTLASRGGDTSQSHQANLDAKKLLASLVSRLTILMKGLDEIAVTQGGLSEGEVRRRTDMIAKIQDRAEVLGKMTAASTALSRAAAAAASSRTNGAPTSATRSSGGDPASRQALLGQTDASWVAAKPITRVLGKAPPPQETAQTRVLDNAGLLQLQMQAMEEVGWGGFRIRWCRRPYFLRTLTRTPTESGGPSVPLTLFLVCQQQDGRLDSLTAVIRRQRELAGAIGVELAQQNELLDSLSDDVDRTGGKLSKAKAQIRRLE